MYEMEAGSREGMTEILKQTYSRRDVLKQDENVWKVSGSGSQTDTVRGETESGSDGARVHEEKKDMWGAEPQQRLQIRTQPLFSADTGEKLRCWFT